MTDCSEPKWKWSVLTGAFIALFIADGWICSFGMIYSNLLIAFDESRVATSYIPTLIYGIPLIASPFSCSVASRVGCRTLSIFAGLVLFVSFILASLCNSLWMVCLVTGLLTSVGLTSLLVSALTAVTYSFEQGHRGLATGIATAGSGLGSIVFPHLLGYLIDEFMWHGAYLIMGAICLNVVISGYLYRPFPKNQLSTTDAELKVNGIDSKEKCEVEQKLAKCGSCIESRGIVLKICKGVARDTAKLMKNRVFVCYCFFYHILYIWINVPHLYTYDWALEYLRLDHNQGAWLLSAQGLALTVGMLLIGFLVDVNAKISPNLVYGICMTVSGTSVFIMPYCHSYTLLLVCCTSFAFASSATFVLPLLCTGEVVGMDWAVAGVGVVYFVEGVSILIGTPIGGWIRDVLGSYNLAFHLAGFFMIFVGSVFCVFFWLKSKVCGSVQRDSKLVEAISNIS